MGKSGLRDILIYQFVLTVIGLFIAYLDSTQNLFPLLMGSLVSLTNLSSPYAFYTYIFQKKNVALGIFIVVIKYAILGFLLWYFLSFLGLPLKAFLIGLIINPLALIFFAILHAKALNNRSKEIR